MIEDRTVVQGSTYSTVQVCTYVHNVNDNENQNQHENEKRKRETKKSENDECEEEQGTNRS